MPRTTHNNWRNTETGEVTPEASIRGLRDMKLVFKAAGGTLVKTADGTSVEGISPIKDIASRNEYNEIVELNMRGADKIAEVAGQLHQFANSDASGPLEAHRARALGNELSLYREPPVRQ